MSDVTVINKSKELLIFYILALLLKYHRWAATGLCNSCSDFILPPPGTAWSRELWKPELGEAGYTPGCRLCALALQQLGQHDVVQEHIRNSIITAETRESDGLSTLHWTMRYLKHREVVRAKMLVQYSGNGTWRPLS
jgi:hypothetical protein